MSLRIIRGLETNRTSFTPAEGEPLFTTDTKKVYIGDGTTPGGVLVTGISAGELAEVKSDSDWILRNILAIVDSESFAIREEMIDSEWIIENTTDRGTLIVPEITTDAITNNLNTSLVTRIENGSSNPDINTTINNAVVNDLIEYEDTGVFYNVTSWVVRRNGDGTVDTLVVVGGNTVFTKTATADSDTDILTVSYGNNTYFRGDIHTSDKTNNIYYYSFKGGEDISFGLTEKDYDGIPQRNQIISDAFESGLFISNHITSLIDSETLARKEAIAALNLGGGGDVTGADSDWVLSISNPNVDSEWVLSQIPQTTGEFDGVALYSGAFVTTNDSDITKTYSLNSAAAQTFAFNMFVPAAVGDTFVATNGLNTVGVFGHVSANTLTIMVVEDDVVTYRAQTALALNYTSNLDEVIGAVPKNLTTSTGRKVKVLSIREEDNNYVIFEALFDPGLTYQTYEFGNDSELQFAISDSIRALYNDLSGKVEVLEQSSSGTLDIVDSEEVIDLIDLHGMDSDQILRMLETENFINKEDSDFTFSGYFLVPEDDTDYTDTIAANRSIYFDYPGENFVITGGNLGTGLLWLNRTGTNWAFIVIDNEIVAWKEDDGTITTNAGVQSGFVASDGATYSVTGYGSESVSIYMDGTTSADRLGGAYSCDFNRTVLPNTYNNTTKNELVFEDLVDSLNVNNLRIIEKLEQTSADNKFYGQVGGELNESSATTFNSNVVTASASVAAAFPFDNIWYSSAASQFDTTTYEFTATRAGVYEFIAEVHQDETNTSPAEVYYVQSRGGTVIGSSPKYDFVHGDQHTTQAHWVTNLASGDGVKLYHKRNLRSSTSLIIKEL